MFQASADPSELFSLKFFLGYLFIRGGVEMREISLSRIFSCVLDFVYVFFLTFEFLYWHG